MSWFFPPPTPYSAGWRGLRSDCTGLSSGFNWPPQSSVRVTIRLSWRHHLVTVGHHSRLGGPPRRQSWIMTSRVNAFTLFSEWDQSRSCFVFFIIFCICLWQWHSLNCWISSLQSSIFLPSLYSSFLSFFHFVLIYFGQTRSWSGSPLTCVF